MVKSIQISGKKLTALRTDILFLSQEELAAKLGVSKGSVGRLEQKGGGMYRSNFRKLAELAKKTPDELIGMIGDGAESHDMPEWAKRFKSYEEAAEALRRFFPDVRRETRPTATASTPYSRGGKEDRPKQ